MLPLLFLFLCVLVLLGTPYGIKYGTEHWLRTHGVVKAEIDDIDFNPFLGKIKISSFKAEGERGNEMNIAEAALNISWLALLKGRFHVQEITIENGVVDIRRIPEAGWLLGIYSLEPPAEKAERADNTRSEEHRWQWGLEKLRLKDVTVRYQETSWQEDIVIAEAELDNINTWQADGVGSFYLRAIKDTSALEVRGVTGWQQGRLTIDGQVTADKLPLNRIRQLKALREITEVQGRLFARQKIKIIFDFREPAGKVQFHTQGKLQGKDLVLTAMGYRTSCSLEADLEAEFKLTGSAAPQKKEVKIEVSGKLEGVDVYDLTKTLDAATVDEITVNNLQLQNGGLVIDSVKFADVKLFQNSVQGGKKVLKKEYIASVPEVLVEKISFAAENVLEIKDMQIKDSGWHLVRDRQGSLKINEWISAPGSAAGEKASSKETPVIVVRLGEIRLTGNNMILFEDHSLNRLYKETAGPFSLKVGKLDSRQTKEPTAIALQTAIGKYSTLAVTGSFTTFADKLSLELQGKLESVNIPALNPYLVQYYDYRFVSGNLDADIDWRLHDGLLKSEISLFIKKIKYQQLEGGRRDRLKDLTGMPFDYFVDLLRDKNDNIRLRLRVEGDSRKPDFKYTDALRQALLAAAKKTTISYFAPLGVTLLTGIALPVGSVYVSGKLVDWVTTLRFKPVVFDRESDQLSDESEEYLGTMSKLLLDRPKVNIILCGKGVLSEIDHQTKEKKQRERLSTKEKEHLLGLARSRAEAVKDSLILRNVPPEQMLICEPEIDGKKGAQPRVEISL